MPMVMPPELRATLVKLYGEQHIERMEAAPRPADAPDAPATEAEARHAAELLRIADEQEAARFAAELERDAQLGSHADWPDL